MTDKVVVSYLHDLKVDVCFFHSFLGLWAHDVNGRGYFNHEHAFMPMRCGTDGLAGARNLAVEVFLATNAQWLLFLDTDMGFKADTLERLMDSANAERPIMAGLYFAQAEVGLDGMGGYLTEARPQLYDLSDEDNMLFMARYEWPRDEVVRVDGTGSGCVLIHRSVFEKVGADWYTRFRTGKGGLLQEDLSFYLRCRERGIPVYVDTSVKCSHAKTVFVCEEVFNAEQTLSAMVMEAMSAHH